MNYKVWFDEKNGILRVDMFQTLVEEDIHEIVPMVEKEFEGRQHQYILADLSKSTSDPISQSARKAFKKYTDSMNYDRIAVIGLNPATRMIAKIVLGIIGKSDVSKFFKTDEEAITWLKGETNEV